jgi:hypothetical protein
MERRAWLRGDALARRPAPILSGAPGTRGGDDKGVEGGVRTSAKESGLVVLVVVVGVGGRLSAPRSSSSSGTSKPWAKMPRSLASCQIAPSESRRIV